MHVKTAKEATQSTHLHLNTMIQPTMNLKKINIDASILAMVDRNTMDRLVMKQCMIRFQTAHLKKINMDHTIHTVHLMRATVLMDPTRILKLTNHHLRFLHQGENTEKFSLKNVLSNMKIFSLQKS